MALATINPNISVDRNVISVVKSKNANELYKVVENAFKVELKGKSTPLGALLSKVGPEEKPIRKIIPQMLLQWGEKGMEILDRINLLIKYLNKEKVNNPLKLLKTNEPFKSFRSLSSFIGDPSLPDLSWEDLEELFEIDYESSSFLGEFYRLSTLQAADEIAEKNLQCGYLSSLLHKAIEANKLYIVTYLIDIGANLNAVKSDFLSPVLKAIRSLAKCPEDNRRFVIVKNLLENRKPIQKVELFNILHFCSYHYKPNDFKFNLHLFDHATSLLLGYKITMRSYFKNNKELFAKYVAHNYEISGTTFDDNDKDNKKMLFDLEGMYKTDYICLRLRLYLQMIVEKSLSHLLNEEEFLAIYKELLSEIETAWLSQILDYWRKANIKKFDSQFYAELSHYVVKQILSLEDTRELTLHSGWPGHSICIVFTKNKDRVSVRIDNLGEGSEKHPTLEDKVQSKLIGKLDISERRNKDLLEKYIISLFETMSSKENVKTLITKVYCPSFANATIQQQKEEEYLWQPLQSVGNCTHASLSVGVNQRLGDNLFHIIEKEMTGSLIAINNYYANNPKEIELQDFPSTFSMNSVKEADFSTQLQKDLMSKYEQFSVSHVPYIMNPNMGRTASKNLSDEIDQILSSKYHVMILGNAGIGKTLLTKKFSQEMASKGMVIHLSLRNLSNEQNYPERKEPYTLIEIIDKELLFTNRKKPLHNIEKRLLELELDKNKGKNVIWVVDGLDELHVLEQLKAALKELMGKKKVVITSRPNVPFPPHLQMEIEKPIRLYNYAPAEILQFIHKHFDIDSPLVEKIKKALGTNAQLAQICSIPITLDIICNLIKNGDERVLTLKNLDEIYDCFVMTMLRNAFTRKHKKEPDYTLKGYYRKALQFTQLLAYNSLIHFRSLSSSEVVIDKCFIECKINPNERAKLLEDLNEIGLLNISRSSAEFVHASFQEYFASRYLVKSLKNPQKILRYKSTDQYIQKHKFDPNYRNIFSLVIYQLAKHFNLQEEFINKFTLINEEDIKSSSHSPYAQGIALLRIYSKFLAEDFFVGGYSNFMGEAFNYLLAKDLRTSISENLSLFIPYLNRFSPLMESFNSLLTTVPFLKKNLNVISRLLTNLSQNMSSPEIVNLFWNTIFFIESIEGLSWEIFSKIGEFIQPIKKNTIKIPFLKGLLQLQIRYIDRNHQTLSAEEIKSITGSCVTYGRLIYNSSNFRDNKEDLDRCQITELLLDFYALLTKIQLDREDLRILLLDYICIIFASNKLKNVASCWKKMTKVLSPKKIEQLFSNGIDDAARHKVLLNSIKILKEGIEHSYQMALKSNNKSSPYRSNFFNEVGYALNELLQPIDYLDVGFGTNLITNLIGVVKDGSKGACSSASAKKACSFEAYNAVIQFIPSDLPSIVKEHLFRLRLIFRTQVVVTNMWIDLNETFIKRTVQERFDQLLAWVKVHDTELFNDINEKM